MNYCKYTSKISNPCINIGKSRINEEQVFYVKDNGAGFEMDYVNKVFEPIQRLHLSEQFEGSGIGLTTVQRIINRPDGKI